MAEDNYAADLSQSTCQHPIPVDEAFRSALARFENRNVAVQCLKELALWGSKGGKWFEIDLDKYGLYLGVQQISDGWRAEVKMQPGSIGIADFADYTWAYEATELDELCKSATEDQTLPRGRRGRKVQFDWPIFQAEFYCRLDRDDVSPRDEINFADWADTLIRWGSEAHDIGENNTPGMTAMRAKVREWAEIWSRKPKS